MPTATFVENLRIDSNNVAAHSQLHTHTSTCIKYMKHCKALAKPLCRFRFPRPLIEQSHVTEDGFIQMKRNHAFLSRYNPVISSAIRCNTDFSFTGTSPKMLAALYYMTNYATKAQTDQGQLVLAAAVLKQIQETTEARAREDSRTVNPPSFDMSKFALKAYNRFTRDVEVGAPAVAHYLLGQPTFYTPFVSKSKTINLYWVKTFFQKQVMLLLKAQPPHNILEDFEQYESFGLRTRRPSPYENYRMRGSRLSSFCLYEYFCQFFVQTRTATKGRRAHLCFDFENNHPLFESHVQVSVASQESLGIPSISGAFCSVPDDKFLESTQTLITQDECHEVLLGLFYPWNLLREDIQDGDVDLLQAEPYKNTWLWNRVFPLLPSHVQQLSHNVMLLRRSKDAADRDRKERGIKIDDYPEAASNEPFLEGDRLDMDIDPIILSPSVQTLLAAVLGLSGMNKELDQLSLCRLPAPTSSVALFTDISINKMWKEEIRVASSRALLALVAIPGESHIQIDMAFVSQIDNLPPGTVSIALLRQVFLQDTSITRLMQLVQHRFSLNKKQSWCINLLLTRVLFPIRISSADNQLLLYLGGVGGVGKTYLIQAFLLGLSILEKEESVLLTATTGAAAANIGGATYHSVLGVDRSGPPSSGDKIRLRSKRIFIVDEVSMMSLEDLTKVNTRCDLLWDRVPGNNTVFGGLPIVIFLGDFNQFPPVGGTALWRTIHEFQTNLCASKAIWNAFRHVVILTDQMRQADDLEFQGFLQRARSATLSFTDLEKLNSHTIQARIANGDVPPDDLVVRLNAFRQEVNSRKLEDFARAREQKIYLFPSDHKITSVRKSHSNDLSFLQTLLQEGEGNRLKAGGFFAFSKGMQIMLQSNINTKHGLVNGMSGTAEKVVLDTAIQADWIELNNLYVLCTSNISCLLVRTSHNHTLELSGIEDGLVPVFPLDMNGEKDGTTFTRTQVPVTLGFAITDYKVQGRTFVALILDLHQARRFDNAKASSHRQWTSLNVQLGRIKSFSGVWLREEVTPQDLSGKPHPDLLNELERLEELEKKTLLML